MKFRMNALHYALVAIVILLIVYYGTNVLREGKDDCTKYCKKWNKHKNLSHTEMKEIYNKMKEQNFACKGDILKKIC